MLQSIDDLLLPVLLEQALSSISSDSAITITEVGCGTGRNTSKLLSLPPSTVKIAEINALDLSPQMLDIAKSRYSSLITQSAPNVSFHVFDALAPDQGSDIDQLRGKADIVLSTLVLEHLPVDAFFTTCASFLKSSGLLIVTNMHAEMGKRSQAGFLDTDGDTKVQGESHNYETDEVIMAGRKAGFEILDGGLTERGIEESDLQTRAVGERGRKWVGCKVWFGGTFRYTD
ncbi:S-adenosyl-L-methionine-dependent methyltransferase [Glarea lozoyensis ATCC 20868]|uniref:S-adenosyl-L-methionine-dependent methyltransferase n=2 Tax=Glarea lozoyensis TaxID=101852 RepID=S3E9Q6_GLAL2|nr:S-adenosyl-L-methionine-dependent methyltransferase [Glarea lozoyensis ATCC 20868]EPE35058.1 S-adenosyl-L-methionine-dependent methyltransferase [Glarea lozoyensis ATCC 20868]